MAAITDPTEVVLEPEALEEYPFGALQLFIENQLQNDYDCKVIITSSNSKPGVGKTTLAIHMARMIDQTGEWSAEEKAVMRGGEYQRAYEELPSGSVILFDEIEYSADSRRAMSHENVGITQAWAMNRYRNICSIVTLPTVSMLDNRLMEMADIWINVMQRGLAKPHHIKVNDYNGKIYKDEFDGVITFSDLPDGDPAYEYLKDRKAKIRKREDTHYNQEEVDKIVEQATESETMELRNELIRELANGAGMSTYDIADLEAIDLSQARVSQIVNQ